MILEYFLVASVVEVILWNSLSPFICKWKLPFSFIASRATLRKVLVVKMLFFSARKRPSTAENVELTVVSHYHLGKGSKILKDYGNFTR